MVFVACAYVMTPLAAALRGVHSDTWLALVSGRGIVHHGLPTVDHFTVWGSGRSWVDQQWLAQLAFTGLAALGGVRLVVFACSASAAAAALIALVAARRRGGSIPAVVWVALVALELYVITAGNPRPQSFAYPLFVALVLLISADSRRPSRRVLLALPLLALWANVHGSVILAAALVVTYSVFVLRTRPRIGVLLGVGAILAVFASPYAFGLPSYYKLLLGSGFGSYVLEWQPARLSLITLPFYALAGWTLYVLGRSRGILTRAETALLLITATAAEIAIRNIIWFALAAICLLPAAVAPLVRSRLARSDLNAAMGAIGVAAVIVIAIAVFASPRTGIRPFPDAAADAAAAAARDGKHVYTTPTYGDWLLWKKPEMTGRVSSDARLELLPAARLRQLASLTEDSRNWKEAANGFDVFLLNVQEDRYLLAALLRNRHAKQVYRGHGAVVLTTLPTR